MVEMYRNGTNLIQLCKAYSKSKRTIVRWIKKYCQDNNIDLHQLRKDNKIKIASKGLIPPFDKSNPLHRYWWLTARSFRRKLNTQAEWSRINGTDGSGRSPWTCAYSGWQFNLNQISMDDTEMRELGLNIQAANGSHRPFAPSPDRIDPTGPYSSENVNWVLQVCNIGRGDMPLDQYFKLCAAVAAFKSV